MIQSFRHKGSERLFIEGKPSGVPAEQRTRLRVILAVLDAADTPREVGISGFRLHPLKGVMKGRWSVRVTRNWRVTFRMHEGDAYDVDLVDYH